MNLPAIDMRFEEFRARAVRRSRALLPARTALEELALAALLLAGLGLVVAGVWRFSHPLGLIAAGVLLVALALGYMRGKP